LFGGRGPNVIGLDTLASASGDIDENSNAFGALLTGNGVVRQLARRLSGATVAVIAHTGKDLSKGARGHSSLHGNSDFMIEVTTDKNTRILSAYLDKQKDGPEKFTIEYNIGPEGRLPIATPIGRAKPKDKPKDDGYKPDAILRILATLYEVGVNERTHQQLYLAICRSERWLNPPGDTDLDRAIAVQRILAGPMTDEERPGWFGAGAKPRAGDGPKALAIRRLISFDGDDQRVANFGTKKIASEKQGAEPGGKGKGWLWQCKVAREIEQDRRRQASGGGQS
jgi:hypothetical protein